MDFSKALEALKDGKKVRRLGMPEGFYLLYDDYQVFCAPNRIYKTIAIIEGDAKKWNHYSANSSDILAEDWEILDENKSLNYMQWLEMCIANSKEDVNICVAEENYQDAAIYQVRLEVFKNCLHVFLKMNKAGEDK